MKITKLILLFCWSLPGTASETNVVFKVLETPGRNYTNATIKSITPAYAVVYHDGGIAKMPTAELPSFLNIKSDTNNVAAFEAQEARDAIVRRVDNLRRTQAVLKTNLAKLEAEKAELDGAVKSAQSLTISSTKERKRRGEVNIGTYVSDYGAGRYAKELRVVEKQITQLKAQIAAIDQQIGAIKSRITTDASP